MDRIKILKQLLELEDYQLVIKETKIVHNIEDDRNILAKINETRSQIDPKILKNYESKGLGREVNACCSNCYMTIAKGDLARLTKDKNNIPSCPSCHSYLYLQCFED